MLRKTPNKLYRREETVYGHRWSVLVALSVDRLREGSVGLPQFLFQAITHMGPAAAVAYSLGVGFTFAGPVMPRAVAITLVYVLLIATSVG